MSTPPTALNQARTLLRERSGRTRIAVVGASNDPAKYGNIIVRNLLRRGYTVLPVHLHERHVAGLPVWRSVAAIEGHVDIVNLVVPPDVARAVVAELPADRIGVVWFQPGAFDADVVAQAQARCGAVVAGDCIMVVAGWA
ncbi:MAG: CoA-binding protein [Myxococcales bacterium]|nr:CoA-binding protein [Myxococcales bacterium]